MCNFVFEMCITGETYMRTNTNLHRIRTEDKKRKKEFTTLNPTILFIVLLFKFPYLIIRFLLTFKLNFCIYIILFIKV